jgi:uncharacterized membrane protein YedE/YeeE
MGKFLVFLSGMLFGIGVTISGMVNPMKILNFLDIFGPWDATLIFVMGGGLLVTFLGYRIVMTRPAPVHAAAFKLPQTEIIDARLLGGAAVFGLGWGLSGFCPGPAVASVVFGQTESIIFVVAMAVGMIIAKQIQNRMRTSEAEAN